MAFAGKSCETRLERNPTNQDNKAVRSNSSRLHTAKNDSNHTESQQRRNCQDYKEAGYNSSGLFTVIDGSNQTFQVFCDFHSEPGFSWNQAYLIERPYLLWLRDYSTHWRATCQYNLDGTVYTDNLRASLENFDVIRDVPTMVETYRP